MLGGSFWVAVLRNGMGAGLMLSVFLLLDRPRWSMGKTIACYVGFGILMVAGYSGWYLSDWYNFIRFAGILTIPLTGIFCLLMSRECIYISIYKLSLSFYLLSVCVVLGVDLSRLWFGGNMWVDILIRFFVNVFLLVFVGKRFRKAFLENLTFLREEMDRFSVVTLVLSVFVASLMAFWPDVHVFSVLKVVRIFVILFMAGMIQYLVFHLYIHLGKEHSYQTENDLLERNEQFLRRQLELVQQAEEDFTRIRHDIRHHCLLLREYASDGENEKLISYLDQYMEDIDRRQPDHICKNHAINGILSVYARMALQKGMQVEMNATVARRLPVRDIDLVAILANVFENAIHGCMRSGASEQKITISVSQKGHKIVIQCRNTCASDLRFGNGLPDGGTGRHVGISCILKTAERYDGEADFSVNDGVFMTRVLLNLPDI